MNSGYCCRDVSRHLSTSLPLSLYQSHTRKVKLSASRCKAASKHIEEIYSKSLSAAFRGMFCQACLASCIAMYKVKPFAVIKPNWIGSLSYFFWLHVLFCQVYTFEIFTLFTHRSKHSDKSQL